jgi:hypothetical protein
VNEKSTHQKLASRCLELMSEPSGLRQNMCNLPRPGVLRNEIDDRAVANSLPAEMQYACRYWTSHLIQSQQDIIVGDTTHIFLQKHLLHCLEAMSLMRESSRCFHLLDSLQALAGVRSSQNIPILLCLRVSRSLQALSQLFFMTLVDLFYGSSPCSRMHRYRSTVLHLCSRPRRALYDRLLSVKYHSGSTCYPHVKLTGTPVAARWRAIPPMSPRWPSRQTGSWSRRHPKTTQYGCGKRPQGRVAAR